MTWDMIGHGWAVQMLRGHIQNKSLRQAYLITGPHGIGKKSLALRFIQALICPQGGDTGQPCLNCSTCQRLERLEHPDLFPVFLEEGSKQIKIDQVRDLIHNLSLSPYEASHRFGLLPDFELANPSTQNALLKTLEEPPQSVILILTAVSSGSLLETITSRCEEIKLNTVPFQQAAQGLQELHGIQADQARVLAHISGGKPLRALEYHQHPKLLERRTALLDEQIEVLRGNSVERFAYADKISKNPDTVDVLLDTWISFWHDLLLLSGKSSAPLQNIDREDNLQRIAKVIDLETARSTVDLFRSAHLLLRENANLRLTLEDLFLQLPTLRI
jgi:DNA polymerase-3 subunit delta'